VCHTKRTNYGGMTGKGQLHPNPMWWLFSSTFYTWGLQGSEWTKWPKATQAGHFGGPMKGFVHTGQVKFPRTCSFQGECPDPLRGGWFLHNVSASSLERLRADLIFQGCGISSLVPGGSQQRSPRLMRMCESPLGRWSPELGSTTPPHWTGNLIWDPTGREFVLSSGELRGGHVLEIHEDEAMVGSGSLCVPPPGLLTPPALSCASTSPSTKP
jgi:hypothetical protein